MHEIGTTKGRFVHFWFAGFRSGNFKLTIKSRRRPELKVNNEKLRAFVDAHASETTQEIAT